MLVKFTFNKDFDKVLTSLPFLLTSTPFLCLKQDRCLQIVPFYFYVCMNTAVFPACLLPSAVSFSTFVLVWLIDMVMLFVALRGLWVPAVRVYFADRKLGKEKTRLSDVEAELKQAEKDQNEAKAVMEKKEAEMQIEKEELDAAQAAAESTGDADAAAKIKKERKDYEEAKKEFEQSKSKLTEAEDDLAASKNDLERENVIELESEAERDAEFAAKEDLFTPEHVKETEFQLLLLLLDEMIEFVVPFGVTILELFLFFGWNSHAVPLISQMTSAEFLESTLAKLLVGFLHVITMWMARNIIDGSTEIHTFTVLTWAIRNYSECVTIASASVFIFCYGALMPHYNLNIDGFGHLFANFITGDEVGVGYEALTTHPSGCYNDTFWEDTRSLVTGNSNGSASG